MRTNSDVEGDLFAQAYEQATPWHRRRSELSDPMSRIPRRRTRHLLALLGAALVTGAYLLFRPVCVPIPEDTLAVFSPPIEQRRETTFYGSRIFQQENGQWFQCKTWIARQFFF